MIDWFCWILLLVGLVIVFTSGFLHRKTRLPVLSWRILGLVLIVLAAILFF